MALNSLLFVVFLCVACLASFLFPAKIRYFWLLLCSWVFYLYSPDGWAEHLPSFALLLLATFASFLCALGIGRAKKQAHKRVFLAASLAVCLGMLAVCKYLDFFASLGLQLSALVTGGGAGEAEFGIIQPLGISYFVLQSVSYTLDVYKGKQPPEKNPALYALYMSFFPGIVTGPINRANEMLPQYQNPRGFDYDRIAGGLFRVLWGLVKKSVIADNIGVFTAKVFGAPGHYNGPYLVLAVLLFAYQLYADFSGSCDIAIGSAHMMGFTFRENFNRPFAATTYRELWKRWHMSLTSFFREYVYFPLGGNRKGKGRQALNTMLVFVLSGLWHGASLGYLVWGALNGAILVVSSFCGGVKERVASGTPVYSLKPVRSFVQRVLVYLMFAGTLAALAFSNYQTPVAEAFGVLATGWDAAGFAAAFAGGTAFGFTVQMVVVVVVAVVLVEALEKLGIKDGGNMALWVRRQKFYVRWPLYYVLLGGFIAFGAFGLSQFIYAQY